MPVFSVSGLFAAQMVVANADPVPLFTAGSIDTIKKSINGYVFTFQSATLDFSGTLNTRSAVLIV